MKSARFVEEVNALRCIGLDINNMIRGFDSIFTIYLQEKGDKEMLENKLDELQKEQEKKNEQEKNGKADKPNLQGDTDGESSGTEGIRKEGK